jgi:hypothetical protein
MQYFKYFTKYLLFLLCYGVSHFQISERKPTVFTGVREILCPFRSSCAVILYLLQSDVTNEVLVFSGSVSDDEM